MKKTDVLERMFYSFFSSLFTDEFLNDDEISKLKQRIKEPPPPWMIEQIQNDLKAFKDDGISQKMLDRTFFSFPGGFQGSPLCRLRFIDGKTHHFCGTKGGTGPYSTGKLGSVLERIHQVVPLPDVDLMFWEKDGLTQYKALYMPEDGGIHDNYIPPNELAPLFAWAKDKSEERVVLFPDWSSFLLDSHVGYSYRWREIAKHTKDASSQHPWEQKKDLAFWRGSCTFGGYTLEEWKSKPRSIVCLLSLKFPDLIDAKFVHKGLAQATREAKKEMKAMGVVGNGAYIPAHLKFKYQISLDGNHCTYPSVAWRLLSNSLLFKQESNNTSWFYNGIKPYEHYIPFRFDASDLLTRLDWAQKHDYYAKKIADNGTKFAKDNLTKDGVYLYVYFLLQEYAKLQTFNLNKLSET